MTIEQRAINLIEQLSIHHDAKQSLISEVGDYLSSSVLDRIKIEIGKLEEQHQHKVAVFEQELLELENLIKSDTKDISEKKQAEEIEQARNLLKNL